MLRIGTYGRGVWQSPLMVGLSTFQRLRLRRSCEHLPSLGDTVQLTDNLRASLLHGTGRSHLLHTTLWVEPTTVLSSH